MCVVTDVDTPSAQLTYNPYIRMCSIASVPKLLVVGPVPQTAFELFLTVLTVIKTFQFVKLSNKQALPPLVSDHDSSL